MNRRKIEKQMYNWSRNKPILGDYVKEGVSNRSSLYIYTKRRRNKFYPKL